MNMAVAHNKEQKKVLPVAAKCNKKIKRSVFVVNMVLYLYFLFKTQFWYILDNRICDVTGFFFF